MNEALMLPHKWLSLTLGTDRGSSKGLAIDEELGKKGGKDG